MAGSTGAGTLTSEGGTNVVGTDGFVELTGGRTVVGPDPALFDGWELFGVETVEVSVVWIATLSPCPESSLVAPNPSPARRTTPARPITTTFEDRPDPFFADGGGGTYDERSSALTVGGTQSPPLKLASSFGCQSAAVADDCASTGSNGRSSSGAMYRGTLSSSDAENDCLAGATVEVRGAKGWTSGGAKLDGRGGGDSGSVGRLVTGGARCCATGGWVSQPDGPDGGEGAIGAGAGGGIGAGSGRDTPSYRHKTHPLHVP